MVTVVLRVPGMACRHCVRAVSAAVRDLVGVEAVQASTAGESLIVQGSFSEDAVRAALADAGHPAE